MARIYYYNPRSRRRVHVSDEPLNFSFNEGINGSLGGYADFENTEGTRSFMGGVFENSHFIKIEVGDILLPGVVSSAHPSDDNAYFRLNFIGFWEYLDKITAISSHLASNDSIAYSENHDISWSKFFYAGSPEGVLLGVLTNLKESMSAAGYDDSVFNVNSIQSTALSRPGGSSRSFRMNTFEYPSIQGIVQEVLDDDNILPLKVEASAGTAYDSRFSFNIGFHTSYTRYDYNASNDDVFDIKVTEGDVLRRSFSIATGSTLTDVNRYEKVTFDNDVAYSSIAIAHPSERSGTIRKSAERNAIKESANSGNFAFSLNYVLTLPTVLSEVRLNLGNGDELRGFVTEISIEGQTVTFTAQEYQEGFTGINDGSLKSVYFKKPAGDLRKVIFNPLDRTARLSQKNASARSNSTNWRT